jgi:hypothetical protein
MEVFMIKILSIPILSLILITKANAAIVANPIPTLVVDKIDSVIVTNYSIDHQKIKVVITGKNSYASLCNTFDKKLKLKKLSPGEIKYEIYGYNDPGKNCNDFDKGITRKYQIDSFVWDSSEKIPDIYVNNKLIN